MKSCKIHHPRRLSEKKVSQASQASRSVMQVSQASQSSKSVKQVSQVSQSSSWSVKQVSQAGESSKSCESCLLLQSRDFQSCFGMKNSIYSSKITNLSVFIISQQKIFKNHPNNGKNSLIFCAYLSALSYRQQFEPF